MMKMRLENIRGYWYLVEFWYDKTRHRNMPNRVRVSEKLAAWINKYAPPLNELGPEMDKNDYPMPRGIKDELKQIFDNPKFHGAKITAKNEAWEQWNIVGHEILNDSLLFQLKRQLTSNDASWKAHGERLLADILKYAGTRPRTPAWDEFLKSQV